MWFLWANFDLTTQQPAIIQSISISAFSDSTFIDDAFTAGQHGVMGCRNKETIR
jgi:hypothetical protein